MTQVYGLSNPIMLGSHSACNRAMNIPMNPSIDPTDRSMLRETMTNTIPVAMMATIAVCRERNQRLRGVRNVPPVQKWKPTQMIRSPMIIPNIRVSISNDLTQRLTVSQGPVAAETGSAP